MAEEQNLENLLQNADQLFDENHFQENIDLLSKYSDQDVPEIQWRKARAMYSLSKATKDAKEKEQYVRQSFELVSAALQKDDNNFAIHKWYSIILDANAGLDGLKARITQLENVKKHMLKAVELNPNDPTSWHILGVFEFNLAELPWIQRKIVSAIFASPPTGTYEKALEFFEKAESLKEGFYTTNWLMLGKSFMALNNMEKAKVYIEKAANCQVLNEDDKNCKEEACKLMKKF
ncbi:regulator of microtubule dynamics protein 1-like isoform X2 [Condylostylus longicornis]|nr:regulator of microtubule dynamics protein 1-like isoform X2 [Condylostylus longicornis]XP_055383374.1 regulator of microtubule dynamics protein 1-like isoform X2 [Condylostylus longicornis]XP_055383375.1 regulator of microtubule dynamics protein 1-like isoform X2 [Condylostylus longicornis]XP_055383376.1 regulator of microtubule dynamics protein 1-like isoform X2 [Condylostylus longicornis]XP_055383377.1 regulator of microtubule dynamics protein 1-like isoform X2 [Condylostylus longicornis]